MLPDHENLSDSEANQSQQIDGNVANDSETALIPVDETTAKNLDRARSGFGASDRSPQTTQPAGSSATTLPVKVQTIIPGTIDG